MSESSHDRVIVTFDDKVTKEEIEKEVAELEQNGGKIYKAWFRDNDSIVNGFSATIPIELHAKYKELNAAGDVLIEPDGVVKINDEERAPLVPG